MSELLDDEGVSPDQVAAGLQQFEKAVRTTYGDRVRDILLFGSRARGDARPDSDADVAVVLADGDWTFWTEKIVLADLAYDVLMEQGLFVQAWPIAKSEWDQPARHHNPRFVENVKRDARGLAEAA